MATKLPTIRKHSTTRTTMNVAPEAVERVRLLLMRPALKDVCYSDFVDWAVDVCEERLLRGGLKA